MFAHYVQRISWSRETCPASAGGPETETETETPRLDDNSGPHDDDDAQCHKDWSSRGTKARRTQRCMVPSMKAGR